MFTTLASAGPHIEIKAEPIFHLGSFPITNSILLGVIGVSILLWLMFSTMNAIKSGKSTTVSRVVFWMFEMLLDAVYSVIPDKKIAHKVAPLSITLFFFIIINYWLGVLPIVGPVTWNGVPMFRGLVADMNMTFALAIISMVVVQLYAIKIHGFGGNIGRYLKNPIKDPAGAFEGVLELIAELSRLLALSLRLFGNVFAGEVLIVVVVYIVGKSALYTVPMAVLPLMIFELFIGAIQAYVFFMLTTVFIALGMATHGDSHSSSDTHNSGRHEAVA